MSIGNIFSGVGLAYTVIAGVVGVGTSVYSDVQVLKVENQRLQAAVVEQSTVKVDVEVLKVTTNELKQNVIYLNTHLKEATDKMNEVLIKLEQRIDKPSFKK